MSMPVVVATGVTASGGREILGIGVDVDLYLRTRQR